MLRSSCFLAAPRRIEFDICAHQRMRPASAGIGDPIVAAAMIDRLVHHAEVINLKGDSYRLRDRDLARIPATEPPTGP